MARIRFPIKGENPINSFEELIQRATDDEPTALFWYGECLWYGENVIKNSELASENYHISAFLLCPQAYERLGDLYRYGQFVWKNTSLACSLFQAAYAMGIRSALTKYALVLIEDVQSSESQMQGKILLKYAMDNGDDYAQYYIDEYYNDANDLEVNIVITDEMKKQWISEALEGLLGEVELQIERIQMLASLSPQEAIEKVPHLKKILSIVENWHHQSSNHTVRRNVDRPEITGIGAGAAFGIANGASILYGMKKFNNPRGGRGYAAERANHLYDLFQGRKSEIRGNDLAKGGPDRIVNGVYIQSKYCSDGSACIRSVFEKGEYKYTVDGKPMPIEVPADEKIYRDAIDAMKNRIANGDVPGVDNPDEAYNLVRRGNVTYQQAVRIAKAGTIESITFDAVNGAVVAANAFGMSALVTFAVGIWNGHDWKESVKMAVESGLKVAGTTFVSTIISSQLVRVINHNVVGVTIEKGSQAIVGMLKPKAAEVFIRAHNSGIMNIYNEPMSHAAELLKNDIITGSVSIALMSIPNAIDLFRGRISGKQMFKNVAQTTASVAGGSVGRQVGGVVGSVLIPIPKVGQVLGGLIGAALGSYWSSNAARYVLDELMDDDSVEMLMIVEDVFQKMVNYYLLSETEAKNVLDDLQQILEIEVLKDMFASANREVFAENLMREYFDEIIQNRQYVIVPETSDMLFALRGILEDIADKNRIVA